MLFYVYALARPVKKNWKIFYIGKGSKRRVFAHEGEARRGHRCHKCNIIRKVWREGGEIQRYILLTTEDEQESFDYEREMIALHGRENLCNLTDGGDGASDPSTQTRAIMSEKAKVRNHRRYADPAEREKVRQRNYARYMNPDERARSAHSTVRTWRDPAIRSRRLAGLKASLLRPDTQYRRSAATATGWQDPEIRDRRIQGIRKTKATPEYKAKRSAITAAVWADPEQHAQRSAAVKKTRSTLESRAKTSVASKEQWKSPDYAARQTAARRAMWADPIKRAEIIATQKAAHARRRALREAARVEDEQAEPKRNDDG